MDLSPDKIVAGAALFADLDTGEQAEIAALLRPFEFASGEVLFREGEIADRLYLIARGHVAIQIGAGERLLLMRTAGPDDAIGEMALNGSAPRSGTATAVEPAAGFYLETGDFDLMRSMGRPLAGKILRRLALELCARVRGATAELDDGDGGGPAARAAVPGSRRSSSQRPPAGPHRLEVLQNSAFFSAFTGEELERVLRRLRERALPGGEVTFREGEPGGSCLVVAEGTIDVSVGRAGAGVRLATLGPGKVVGELPLVDSGPRSATCTAHDDTVLLELHAPISTPSPPRMRAPRCGSGRPSIATSSRRCTGRMQPGLVKPTRREPERPANRPRS